MFGPFRLDANQRLLFRENTEVFLTPKVFDTLLVLVEHHGRVLDKDYLMRALWPNSFVEETSLARNISLLRKTLGECPEDQKYIQTIPRRGYRFVAHVDSVAQEEPAEVAHGSNQLRPALELDHAGDWIAENGVDASRHVPLELQIDRHEIPDTVPSQAPAPIPLRLLLLATLCFLAGLAISGVAGWKLGRTRSQPVTRATVVLPSDERLGATLDVPIVLSPDGSHMVYAAQKGNDLPRLYVRAMNSLESRSLEGTERANHPFYFP